MVGILFYLKGRKKFRIGNIYWKVLISARKKFLNILANVGQNLTTNPIQNRNETEQKRVFQPLPLGAFERNTNMRKASIEI